jgi:hypothetical protein
VNQVGSCDRNAAKFTGGLQGRLAPMLRAESGAAAALHRHITEFALVGTHRRMNFGLTRTEADDMAVYIARLAK